MSGDVSPVPPDVEAAASFLDPRLALWPGFSMAAAAAVQHLHDQVGLDLWLVTHVDQDSEVAVAAAGFWPELATLGTVLSWRDSYCLRMVKQRGPTVAADVFAIPAYAAVTTGVLSQVRAYIGVPLRDERGQLFGTVCGFGRRPQPDTLADCTRLVQLVGQLLSTILALEQLALARSRAATAATALAEGDRLTGLRNRSGWESALTRQDERIRRSGTATSVLALDLDDLKRINDLAGHTAGDELLVKCASVLTGATRPGDVLARVGGDEFGVLAPDCDAIAARGMLTRLRVALRTAGVAASAGSATQTAHEALTVTWRRADEAMYQDKQRRKQCRITDNGTADY